ncbi:MAG: right-handed parallel beta-helix repeat-containing protein [Kiritimatiellia bacterium]
MIHRFLAASLVGFGFAVCAPARAPAPRPYTINVRPGDSLIAVRDAIRNLPATNRIHGVEVVLSQGRYPIAESLALTAADSGTDGFPVIWRSDGTGPAVLCDGVTLCAADFRKAADDPRIDGAAAEHVLVADLTPCKISYWSTRTKEFRQPTPIPEVFIDGRRLTPAQWPNGDRWTTISKFIDKGTQDNDGSVTQGLGVPRKGAKQAPRGGVFAYEGNRPSRWTNVAELWLHGFWCFDWYDSVIPVAAVNTASNTIAFAAKHTYGVRAGNPSPRRWKAIHLLEELDVPGEYFIDRDAKRLYLWPYQPLVAGRTRIVVTSQPRALVSVDKAHDLVFRDLTFEECWGDGAVVKNSSRIVFAGSRFRNIRMKAISMVDCRDCRVTTCDIFDTGSGGLHIAGGDRRTLTPGNNMVEDTLIRDFSRHCLTYASAIQVNGVGNRVRHCEISGAPHMAIGVYGNDHVFEFNVISNVCMCSDDAAAFYKGRNPSCRGNVLRYNFWSEIGSPRGHGNAAVYFDDGDCGDTVFGNVFYKCGDPGFGGFGTVFCHGGHSNLVDNCLFIDCKRPLGSAPWNQKRWADFLKSPLEQTRLLKEVCVTDAVWTAHYPAIKALFAPEEDNARWNLATRNAFIDCPLALPGRKPGETMPGIARGRWATNATDVVFTGDPGFHNAAEKDFRLRPDAKVFREIPSFEPIPFEKIGLLNRR